MSNFDNNTIDYNTIDWGAPRYTEETVNFEVEVQLALDRPNIMSIFHEEGKPLLVEAVCPPPQAGEAVAVVDDGKYKVCFVDIYEAGPVLKITAPKGSFFLAHSRGRVVTYTT